MEAATRAFLDGRQPTARFIDPAQIGALIAFLCSEAAREITGASIPIDDAWTVSP
jgi:3-hydroxybutyrate dehydrogenase